MKKILISIVLLGTIFGCGTEVTHAAVGSHVFSNVPTKAAATFTFSSVPPKKYKVGGRTYTLNRYIHENGCYIGFYS
ncbi:exported hypothetical protein [Carnobacterium maltaromaticum]|uniref:hypothetical protein n=1 Tax=Carnobacterium maltaromaticum TaxID=2751 RepID=UPI00191BB170|nr:hypothetical protein [Carnobacterium maltaromaticum]CAD5901018.1 exported hypothetical protein [Carnobacterium maltaromaticum]